MEKNLVLKQVTASKLQETIEQLKQSNSLLILHLENQASEIEALKNEHKKEREEWKLFQDKVAPFFNRYILPSKYDPSFDKVVQKFTFGAYEVDCTGLSTLMGRRHFFRKFVTKTIQDDETLSKIDKKKDKNLIKMLCLAAIHLWNEMTDSPLLWINEIVHSHQVITWTQSLVNVRDEAVKRLKSKTGKKAKKAKRSTCLDSNLLSGLSQTIESGSFF